MLNKNLSLLNAFFVLLFGAFSVGCDTTSKNRLSTATPSPTRDSAGVSPSPNVSSSAQTPNSTTATMSGGVGDKDMERYASKEAKEAVAFMVSSDRLESVHNNARIGLSFGVPKGFQETTFTALSPKDIAKKFNASAANNISITPLQTFSDGQNSFVVSLVSAPAGLSRKEFLDLYETINKDRFAPALLTVTAFKNRDMEMTQFFIQESERGLFRILTKGKKANEYAQFDYTVQRASVKADMDKIEPSIGSILRITENMNP